MRQKSLVLWLLAPMLWLLPSFTLVANKNFVEFKPQKAQFVSPASAKKSAETPVKSSATPKTMAYSPISDAYIKNLISETVSQMIANQKLKGEKGDKGDPGGSVLGATTTFNPDSAGLQQVYLPGAVMGPDVGSFFSATNLSSDNITSSSANLGDIESDGNLTVTGDANLQGNITLATTTVASINVGALTSNSGAFLSTGGVWTNASSREIKENFATVSPNSILNKIAGLPIYQWNYKKENASTTHIGPLAEDFYAGFQLGGEKGKASISTIDPAGVALAGIQALDARIKSLLDFSWILDGFKKLGIEIANGIIKAKAFVAESIQTDKLEVGSSENPTGMTIYDRATKQPVCVFAENGVLKSEDGKCGTHPASAPEQATNGNSKETLPETQKTENLTGPPEPENLSLHAEALEAASSAEPSAVAIDEHAQGVVIAND